MLPRLYIIYIIHELSLVILNSNDFGHSTYVISHMYREQISSLLNRSANKNYVLH